MFFGKMKDKPQIRNMIIIWDSDWLMWWLENNRSFLRYHQMIVFLLQPEVCWHWLENRWLFLVHRGIFHWMQQSWRQNVQIIMVTTSIRELISISTLLIPTADSYAQFEMVTSTPLPEMFTLMVPFCMPSALTARESGVVPDWIWTAV